MATEVEYQTTTANTEIVDMSGQISTYEAKIRYQTEMYDGMKYLNQILLVSYMGLFAIIHVVLFYQYTIDKRNQVMLDNVWIGILFFYPYVIYYVEKAVYTSIMYVASIIYGKTYVSNFDKIMLFTDFYKAPINN